MRIRRIVLSFMQIMSVAICLSVGVACLSYAAEKEMPWHEYYMNAEKAAQQKNWERAVTLLQKAIEKEPQPARFENIPGRLKPIQYFPYLALARAYHQLGNDEESRKACEQAKEYGVEPKFLIDRCLNIGEQKPGDALKPSPESLEQDTTVDAPPSQPVIEPGAKIAVLNFQGLMVAEDFGEAVSEIFRTELAGFGDFVVIERGMVEQVLQEQQLQLTGAVDSNTAVQIGKLTGAQFLIIGSIIKTGTVYTINARLIDAETGVAKTGDNVKGDGEEKIPDMVTELTEKILYQPSNNQ